MDITSVVEGRRILWVETDRLIIVLYCTLTIRFIIVGEPPVVEGKGIARTKSDCLVIVLNRPIVIFLVKVNISTAVEGDRVVWI